MILPWGRVVRANKKTRENYGYRNWKSIMRPSNQMLILCQRRVYDLMSFFF